MTPANPKRAAAVDGDQAGAEGSLPDPEDGFEGIGGAENVVASLRHLAGQRRQALADDGEDVDVDAATLMQLGDMASRKRVRFSSCGTIPVKSRGM